MSGELDRAICSISHSGTGEFSILNLDNNLFVARYSQSVRIIELNCFTKK